MLEDFQPEAQIDQKKALRNAAIARLAKFIEQHLYSIDWTILAETGVLETSLVPYDMSASDGHRGSGTLITQARSSSS